LRPGDEVGYEQRMATIADSVCPLDCPDTCSLSVTLDGGRVVAVDGSTRNPYTDGFICAKVRRYPERIYSPHRVRYPQRRVGAKGEGRFERIGWDEAVDLIASRFRQIIARDGAEAIVPYHYGGSNGLFGEGASDARFFNKLGASELLKTLCAAPTGAVYRAMYGGMGGVPPTDYALARAILLWGVNPSATSIHLVPQVRAAQQAGAFVAVIDPRRTPLARAADLHLALRPGTDVVLALAMINEINARGLVDRAFVAAHTSGFEMLAESARAYPMARTADICGIDTGDIARLVEAYAAASPAVVRCGWGVERNRNGGNAVRAILALPAIAGKFGVRGGGMTMSLSRAFPVNAVNLARPGLRTRPPRQINMTQLGRLLTEPQEPPIRALFVYNANPVATTPDQNRILAGLANEDLFTVVHDQVLTDTGRYADVLLPATTVFEQTELHKSYGHYFLQYSDALIPPVGESLSNPEMFARLSRAMGFDEPELQASEETLLRDAMEFDSTRIGGVDLESLRSERIATVRFDRGSEELVQFVTDFPSTPTGRVELAPAELGPVAYQPQPETLPLTLLSPASNKLINSIFGEFNLSSPTLDMHPDDAHARGLRAGAVVRVFNQYGEVEVPLRVTDEVRPGVVTLPKGLWRSSTRNGATATALVSDALTDIGGGACYNDARVEVVGAMQERGNAVHRPREAGENPRGGPAVGSRST
jgi:anaerobic selenocysteine-containing dehydrogenase